jgi:SSS family solute:Na+ symporter
MIGVGYYFSKKSKTSAQFTSASGKIPGWAIGLSIYATFLSSNTFLGVPGKAFGSDWNSYVFSLSMPFAAWFASKYFIPFYRSTGSVSAYSHLEKRFGVWARTYAVLCFLLTQLARMGTIFFGIAISLQALTNYSMSSIMIVMGICIVIYTVMGGIEAVIWTEVVQGVVKTIGAFLILYLVIKDTPGGVSKILELGIDEQKFSLGSFSPNFYESSFWMVLFYGFFINLNNFGMDQNYVQRYHAATSNKEAIKSVWLCVYIYVPASLLFFIIGTALYAFYQTHPEFLNDIKINVATDRLPVNSSPTEITRVASNLNPSDYGDKIMPDFMSKKIPPGLLGLIISAILSAAMSTISSSMNASATVFLEDIYKRYVVRDSTDKQGMSVLYVATVVFGILGLLMGLSMIGVKSVLDVWWQLSGIFAGGMLGLFLLGLISKRSKSPEAVTASIIGFLIIVWMSVSEYIPDRYSFLISPFHKNMVIVIGTLSIFLTGLLLTSLKRRTSA